MKTPPAAKPPHPPRPGAYSISNIWNGADMTPDEVEFGKAVERFRRRHNVKFPSCRQLLQIARELGYRKVRPRKPK